ncbi:MAG: hypothetical protein ABSH45_19365 [Bryobacteraceae bacterium]|jgi:hypothetical protein
MELMFMDKKTLITVSMVAAVLAWTACSNAPEPTAADTKAAEAKKEPPKAPEPVTGQTAFYEMYKPARTWATDLQPILLASKEISSVKNEGGKAALWTAVFVSPSLRQARTFTWAAADDGVAVHKGVTAGGAEAWSGATRDSRPFANSDFHTDSDAAYQSALALAGDWVKSHPDKKPSFVLGSSAKYPQPVWLVIWGNQTSGYAAYVNALTGIASLK